MNYKIINKKSCCIQQSVKIGKGCIIYPNNTILGSTQIKDGCIVYPGNVIIDSIIGQNCVIKTSYITNSIIGDNCAVGPFSNLRENNIIGNNCKIGDFCELKNCKMGNNTKASHHAYLGDVDIGEKVNIGAGVIVANYDGKSKHHSTICEGAFIGCNCNIISPVTIAKNTFVCAGTTVTDSTCENDFIIARVRQCVKQKPHNI